MVLEIVSNKAEWITTVENVKILNGEIVIWCRIRH